MEAAGIVLAALSATEQCLKVGDAVIDMYRSYRNAESDVTRYTIELCIHLRRGELQILEIKRNEANIGHGLQLEVYGVLAMFRTQLDKIKLILNDIIGDKDHAADSTSLLSKSGDVHRLKYAVWKHSKLKTALSDLEKVHVLLDQLCALLTMHKVVQDSSMTGLVLASDKPARASIFLPAATLGTGRITIKFSSAALCEENFGGERGRKPVLVDSIPCDPQTTDQSVLVNVRELGRRLSEAQPSVHGLLRCKGIIRQQIAGVGISQLDFVFEMPKQMRHPRSLRDVMTDVRIQERYSLDERVDLARQLCNSVLFVHTADFVHKNIKPENILVFDQKDNQRLHCFLIGFQEARPANTQWSTKVGDMLWHKNIYRHPKRQGAWPQDKYKMQHDMYSLGVCLLELGLWMSLVRWKDRNGTVVPVPGPGLTFIASREGVTMNRSVCLSTALAALSVESPDQEAMEYWYDESFANDRAMMLTEAFIDVARTILPSRMGRKYAAITVSCLTCLDEGNEDFGDDMADEDGIEIGMKYMEKISSKIQEINP